MRLDSSGGHILAQVELLHVFAQLVPVDIMLKACPGNETRLTGNSYVGGVVGLTFGVSTFVELF